MSPDDPSEPPGGERRAWSPETWRDDRPVREPERPSPPQAPHPPERRPPDPRGSDRPRPSRASLGRRRLARTLRTQPPARGRRVRRTVRHIDPWSVLKLSLLFNAAIFLIVCVASVLLWGGARASGTLDNLESFITSFGFGTCEGDPNATPSTTTSTSTSTTLSPGGTASDQAGAGATTTTAEPEVVSTLAERTNGDDDCPPGEHLVGGFKFEDLRVFEVFAFGGIVLVLAGTGATVVVALLFNLMSDLTGGLQVWVIEEDPRARRGAESGSPRSDARD